MGNGDGAVKAKQPLDQAGTKTGVKSAEGADPLRDQFLDSIKAEATGTKSPNPQRTTSSERNGGASQTEESKPPARDAKDKTVASDRTTQSGASDDVDDPYDHIEKARQARAELDQIHDGKKPQDAAHVRELKQEVASQIQAANKAVSEINFDKGPNSINSLVEQNQKNKIDLAKSLGLDPNKISPELLKSEYEKAKGDKEKQGKIEQLIVGMQEREGLEMIRHAPAYVKVFEAEMASLGYSNPNLGIKDAPSQKDIDKAYDLLKTAGTIDPDFKATDMYSRSEASIGLVLSGYQQERSQQIIQYMTWATEAAKPENGGKLTVNEDGKQKTYSQEDFLKKANELANKIDVSFLVNQTGIQRNIDSGVSAQLLSIVGVAKHAQLDYAEYLVNHGKSDEALLLFNKVKTDTPNLIYKDDGSYRDERMKKLDEMITMGVQATGGNWEQANGKFMQALNDGKTGDAQKQLLEMQKSTNSLKEEYAREKQRLDQRKQELQKQEEDYKKKQNLSETEKIDLWRVQREMMVIDRENASRQAFLQRRENLDTYMSGLWFQAKEDYSAANQKFDSFNRNEHDDKLKQDLKIQDKLDETAGGFKGWWHRNWGYVAIGTAAVAAAAVTVGTLGAGTALGVGILGTTVAAVGLGSTAGGLAYMGVEKTVHNDIGFNQAGLNSFMKGAKIGALTSGMIVAPWAVAHAAPAAATAVVAAEGTTLATTATTGGAALLTESAALTGTAATGTTVAGATGTGLAATEGTVAATNTAAQAGGWGSNLLNLGRSIGLSSSTIKPVFAAAASTSFVTSGADYLTGQKTLSEAGLEFGRDTVMNTLMFGVSTKWAAAKEAAKDAPTLARMVGLSKGTAAAGFGMSGLMEAHNVLRGQKTLADAGKDFVMNGTVNTLTLGLIRGRMLNGPVANSGEFLNNLQYARNSIVFNEAFNQAISQGGQYFVHDIAGKDTTGLFGDDQFFFPIVQDYYKRHLGNGLNPLHPGENQRFNQNLDDMGREFDRVHRVDQKFIDPGKINQRSVFGTGDEQPEQSPPDQ